MIDQSIHKGIGALQNSRLNELLLVENAIRIVLCLCGSEQRLLMGLVVFYSEVVTYTNTHQLHVTVLLFNLAAIRLLDHLKAVPYSSFQLVKPDLRCSKARSSCSDVQPFPHPHQLANKKSQWFVSYAAFFVAHEAEGL